ncbi:MAG: hypothetical protein KF712_00015 [Akkermansiaceae bacterium]|nr:hypothetical protein [Akkermansiaceae bacterium]
MKYSLLLILPALLSVTGCNKNHKPALSNRQLLEAMDGYIFEVTLPANVTAKDNAGLAILRPGGKIELFGGSLLGEGTSKVTVVCFSPDEGNFRWKLFYGSGNVGGRTRSFPKTSAHSTMARPKGNAPGETLIRFSADGSVNHTPGPPTGDDFDLIFHVEKRTGP